MKQVNFNKHSNLLEQAIYKYSLQDVPKPNLYREVFPFEEIPRVTFNHRHVPPHVPDETLVSAGMTSPAFVITGMKCDSRFPSVMPFRTTPISSPYSGG